MKLNPKQEKALKAMTADQRKGYDALPNDNQRLQTLNTLVSKSEAAAKQGAATADGAKKQPKAPKAADERKITLLAEKNPKRGASAARFALYKSGMTVDAYCSACASLGDGQGRAGRADITWDADHKFISVA